MLGQQVTIEPSPLTKLFFLSVVRDQAMFFFPAIAIFAGIIRSWSESGTPYGDSLSILFTVALPSMVSLPRLVRVRSIL
jgi:hypothetical protein